MKSVLISSESELKKVINEFLTRFWWVLLTHHPLNIINIKLSICFLEIKSYFFFNVPFVLVSVW